MENEYIVTPNGELISTYELYHHGIKGMKWGIRRYQNKDGSLTPAGEKRRARLEGKLEKLNGKKSTKEAAVSAETVKRKRASDMSDDELVNAINRARLEDTYNQLRPAPVKKPSTAKRLADEVIGPALIDAGKNLAKTAVDKAIKKLTGDKVDPNSLEALKSTYEKLDYKNKIDKLLNPEKYLTEDEKTKRVDREIKLEDRNAKMEGYTDAADKAAKTRSAAENERKVSADEAARVANEATSKSYYDATYRNRGVGKEYVNTTKSSSLPAVVNNSNVSSGKTVVDFILLDSGGNVIRTYNSDDDVRYRR